MFQHFQVVGFVDQMLSAELKGSRQRSQTELSSDSLFLKAESLRKVRFFASNSGCTHGPEKAGIYGSEWMCIIPILIYIYIHIYIYTNIYIYTYIYIRCSKDFDPFPVPASSNISIHLLHHCLDIFLHPSSLSAPGTWLNICGD